MSLTNYNKTFHFIDLKTNSLIEYNITNENIIQFLYKLYHLELIVPHKFLLEWLKIKKEINVQEIKDFLSQIEEEIPLFNIYFNKVCLISKNDVYDKVIGKNFRFIDKYLLKDFLNSFISIQKLLKIDKSEMTLTYFKKLSKDLFYLSNFNLNILLKTYLKIFYFYSNQVGKNLTTCIRPSFISYNLATSKPYYSRSELINLALNMGIIQEDQTYYDPSKVYHLCKEIQNNDISVLIIIKHQQYIEKNSGKYLTKFFTFYGSYFMNKYLRNVEKDIMFKDDFLETLILKMWKLIYNAPAFDKSYIVYRFISEDSFLRKLKIGDIFNDPGFISTTRNPFYDYKNNNFGFVILKIKLPKDISGIGLCIETYSLFEHEEEIILPPNSLLRLIKITDNYNYYHPSITAKKMIVKMYEFDLIGKKNIIFNIDYSPVKITNLIDPLVAIKNDDDDIYNRIKFFDDTYVNEINTVKIKIEGKTYTFICNWYNSLDVYNDFFYIKTKLGYIMYIQNDIGQIILSLEINSIISVNYFQKFSDINNNTNLSDDELLKVISYISFMFRVNNVIIHPYYNTCKIFKRNHKVEQLMGDTYVVLHQAADLVTFCTDIYEYMKHDKIRFSGVSGIINNFYYFQLDKLKTTSVTEIVRSTDNDDLYQYYINVYSKLYPHRDLKSFYIFVVEQYFYKLNILEYKMKRLFLDVATNPFINKVYNFEPYTYLYENNIIVDIPLFSSKNYGEHTFTINNIYQRIYNNEYREFRYNRKQ